jgi:D-inositol-3-phosphate glycosyltransferase
LHTDTRQRGCELLPLVHARGIRDRLLSTSMAAGAPEVADHQLNLIYNDCDVGLNTSVGEGWGMVAFEHGATGAVQVMPRHSACEELWPGAGVLLEALEIVRGRHSAVDYHCTTPELVAAALEALYVNPKTDSTESERPTPTPPIQNIAGAGSRSSGTHCLQK